ncbi:MAG: hypothetical protein ACM3YM_04370 [Sphingomonadales bacterium]
MRLVQSIALSAAAAFAIPSAAEAAAACDRACLETQVGNYLDALASHDRAKAALAPGVRFTENGQELAVGDGLWGTITGLGSYRHVFADPDSGQAAVITTVTEHAARSILVARLKLTDGRITEIETIVSRPGGSGPMARGGEMLEERKAPEAIWTSAVPPTERMSRADLQRVANKYFAGLEKNDGKGDYPFSDDCNRIENGFQTTNQKAPSGASGPAATIMTLGCKAQFQTGFFRFVDRIRDRRFPLIDVERGVVFALGFFDHSGTVPKVTLTDGQTVDVSLTSPFTWEIGEAFKIEKGRIRRIEAAMTQSPYGMRPNWPD